MACNSPAQIVEITPQRGSVEVHTNQAVEVRFDRAVDQASVTSRFHVDPGVAGQIIWKNPATLWFQHPPLAVDSDYTVVVESGFRDQAGIPSQFRHSWRFRTEGPPVALGSTPSNHDHGVDPTAYLSIGFSHPMDAGSFLGAVTLTPAVPYMVRLDPSDTRRVVIAPRSVLEPDTEYTVAVTSRARDADGNPVSPSRFLFDTGPLRSLQRWITFTATPAAGTGDSAIWMVDESRFPRLLAEAPVDRFDLGSPGTSLLVHRLGGWSLEAPGAVSVNLPFDADWATYLGPDLGYVYLRDGNLQRLFADGRVEAIASGVGEAAIAPGQARVAFTVSGGRDEVDGFDLDLRARFVLLRDSGPISDLAWSANGLRLAYVLAGPTPAQKRLRVKSLGASGALSTLATGDVAGPAWLGNSNYLAFSARLEAGGQSRIFRVNASAPPSVLGAPQALGALPSIDAWDPRPSPDGHQIAFLDGPPNSAQIWLMNADGTGLQQLTGLDQENFPFFCSGIHWG